MDRFRCPLCKKNYADYKAAGLAREADEMLALWHKYQSVKSLNLATTGVKKLDCLLEVLFGHPRTTNWRQVPVKHTSPFIVMRTVALGRVERAEPT